MKQLILLPCIIFISVCSFAQKINSPGYIIKNNGDSVHGLLQEEVKSEIVQQVKFNDQKSTTDNTFKPADIKSFGYDQGNFYRSVSFKSDVNAVNESKNYFAKQLVHGEFDLFTYVENESTYFVVYGNDTSYLLYNTTYNALGAVNSDGNFNQGIIRLGANCEKINSTSWVVATEKSVTKFITELNQCVAPEKASSTFYHKDKITMHPFAYAGGYPGGKNNQVTIEGGIKLSSPQISKKAYLSIGIHYSNIMTSEESLSPGNIKYETDTRHVILSIPVTVQFNFTSGIVQPYINFGLSFARHTETTYATHYNSLKENTEWGLAGVVSAGIEIHVAKSIFVNAQWRFEELLQDLNIYQYPTFGVACRF